MGVTRLEIDRLEHSIKYLVWRRTNVSRQSVYFNRFTAEIGRLEYKLKGLKNGTEKR